MTHAEILERLIKDIPASNQKGVDDLKVPPPCFFDMEAKFVEYIPKKSLSISMPVLEKQTNPAGFMQGGYIAAAFDNAFGPFSYLIAKNPTASIDMNIQYIRPVKQEQIILIKARLVARGFTTLAMAGEMTDDRGRLLATSQTNLVIFKKKY